MNFAAGIAGLSGRLQPASCRGSSRAQPVEASRLHVPEPPPGQRGNKPRTWRSALQQQPQVPRQSRQQLHLVDGPTTPQPLLPATRPGRRLLAGQAHLPATAFPVQLQASGRFTAPQGQVHPGRPLHGFQPTHQAQLVKLQRRELLVVVGHQQRFRAALQRKPPPAEVPGDGAHVTHKQQLRQIFHGGSSRFGRACKLPVPPGRGVFPAAPWDSFPHRHTRRGFPGLPEKVLLPRLAKPARSGRS